MSYRLLILDDGLGVTKLVRSILTDQPFEIIEGEKDHPALTQVKKYQADILMLDFNISADQDGYFLTKEIKKNYKDIKVLLVFDTFDQPDQQKMNDAQVDDYIYRPFDGEKLITTCRHLVGLESTRSIIRKEGVKAVNQMDEQKAKSVLEEELSQWEILIPEIINPKATESEEFENAIVPGVMGGETNNFQEEDTQESKSSKKLNYPSPEDLAFPDEPTKTEQTSIIKSPTLPKSIEPVERVDEKTAVVDLAQLAAAQKDLLGKLKEQIQDEVETDFWSPEEAEVVPAEMSKNTVMSKTTSNQHQTPLPESIFEKVEQQALKQEVMANVRDQMLSELKKEIIQELRAQIVTNLSKEDHEQLVSDLKKNFIKEMKNKIYEDLFSKMSKEIHHELGNKIKENLAQDAQDFLESKIRDYFKKEAVPAIQRDLPVLAQELIQNELIRIRRLIDGE